MNTSADKLTVGTIAAGSKKSTKSFELTPKLQSYSLNYTSQMGNNGNKWVSTTCSACSVSGKCKTCAGSGTVNCSAAIMPGGSKCFYCNNYGTMNCPTCLGSTKCQTCSGKGVRNILKAVN